jgi:hydroxypyruvate isomerase
MPRVTRRKALEAAAIAAAAGLSHADLAAAQPSGRVVTRGRLKQSVSRWCYGKIPMPDFCKAVAGMGLTAIDLLEEKDWSIVRDHGLICSMAYAGGGTIPDGLNVRANHDAIVKGFETMIPRAAAQKIPNVITFFGNRRGMPDAEAIANCIDGLNRVKKLGEENNVTICVELLNSKVDHQGYQGDHTAFGAAVIEGVGSPRVKLLSDIYHMQIMEGDVIRTIRTHAAHIGHFHTGGVPGRHELDDTQELNWHAVARAIADTGFSGYVAHEFVPTKEPLVSLSEAVKTCTV